jgi:plastocyanin
MADKGGLWRTAAVGALAVSMVALAGCGAGSSAQTGAGAQAASAAASTASASAPAAAAADYSPQTREFTVVIVPLEVHEMQNMLGFLKQDFAQGGVLANKEVYGFYPSTLVVYQGDSVNLTVVNPTDDDHTFTVAALGVSQDIKGQSSVQVHLTAAKPGVYQFTCVVPEHQPYQWGQLVVLPARDAA